jgi:MarR family transcriptional regulator, organic hydroperoxide resistance regulator
VSGEASTSPQPRTKIEELRTALGQLFGAERRLRSRDHQRTGELTYGQIRALAALGREQEMTAGHLAKSADLNPATMTAMLDQLETASIVQRVRSTADRRVCNVSLTPEGWKLLQGKLADWQAMWEERMAGVSDEELESAVRVFERITGIFEAVAARPGEQATPARPSKQTA